MRQRLVEGFDPFQNGWDAFDEGGLDAVELIEAPLMLYTPESELADAIAERYRDQGLEAHDLRFGVWPDAFPVQRREAGEPVPVHLNVFGGRQVSHINTTDVERAALSELTWAISRHVQQKIEPAHGVSNHTFGKIPTTHEHVVARELPEDATAYWQERGKVDLKVRRAMRERVGLGAEHREAIEQHIGATLLSFAR